MPLENNDRARKRDRLELDMDSLNLDLVSERYRSHLAELRAWFNMTDDLVTNDSDYEPASGLVPGLYKSTTNK